MYKLLPILLYVYSNVLLSYGRSNADHNYTDKLQSAHQRAQESSSVRLSTPEECMRECRDGEPPKYCYWYFTIEYYTTMGAACNFCKPNNTNQFSGQAQCECIIGDGVEKTVFSINRMIPGPSIQVCLHDRVIIDVDSQADGIEVSLHWHGLFQDGYQYYDGVPYLTQCPIRSGNVFRYQFAANNAGTHFYHSHVSVHMLDGQYGSLIVRSPPSQEPSYDLYDEDLPDHVIYLSDWMHELSLEHFPGLYLHDRGQVAHNILINGKGNWKDPNTGNSTGAPIETFGVEINKRYRFRMINGFSTVCLAQLSIQNHSMQVIAQDGESVEPATVDTIISATGERVDFVLETNQPAGSYWMQVRGLGECEKKQVQQLAIVSYSGAIGDTLSPEPQYYNGIPGNVLLNPPNATTCSNPKADPRLVCVNQLKSTEQTDPELLKKVPDYQIITSFSFFEFNRSLELLFGEPGVYKRFMAAIDKSHVASLMGNYSYAEPEAPPLSQKEGYERLCGTHQTPEDCTEPCYCTHVYHIPLNAVVEVALFDVAPAPLLAHPFHLHGYAFTMFDIGQFDTNITLGQVKEVMAVHQRRIDNGEYHRPPLKDTVLVPTGGYVIFRFKASNPGWWIYHCHFSWHIATGMSVVFHVGTRYDLPPVPSGFPKCYSWTPQIDV